jgi:hypothetical protein
MKLRNIAPDYWRIPHFNKEISNMTHDDIELESPIDFRCFKVVNNQFERRQDFNEILIKNNINF